MKLSMETYQLAKRFGYEKALLLIREAGFDGADFSFYKPLAGTDITEREDYREYAAHLRDYASSIGLELTQAHAPWVCEYGDAFSPDASAHFATTVRAIEAASIMGIPRIVVHAIKTPLEDRAADFLSCNRAYYTALLSYAEKFGIQIAVENLFMQDKKRKSYHPIFGEPTELTAFVDSLDSPYVTACVDVGHVSITGHEPEYYLSGMDARHLGALHIHDNDYLGDNHNLPFLGKFNWEAIANALARIGYNGDFTFEIMHYYDQFPDELIPAALSLSVTVGRYLIGRVERARETL